MKTHRQKLTDNLTTILVVVLIALSIVAAFQVDSEGSANGPTIVEGLEDAASE